MITFRKLRFKNFLSTGNHFSEIQFDKSQNTLVVGTNGAGKSTMLDALCFALFNKAFRNVTKPQLVNSINNKDCIVEIEFDSNNKSYKIIRGIKPNIFEIYCNGELVNQDAAVRDYQEYLEKFVLKLNYKSFTQIVILGSASFVPFMQLSSSDRRSIIEDLLDIQIFSTMNGLLKDRVLVNKEESVENKYQAELTTQNYDLQEKHIKQSKQNNDDKIAEYEVEIANNESQIVTINSEIVELTTSIATIQESISDKPELDGKIKKITKLESQIETNISKFKKDITFFETNDSCPTCRQSIQSDFKQEQVNDLTSKVVECNHGLDQLESKLLETQSRLTEIQSKLADIHSLQVSVATKNTTVTEINKYITKLQKQIQTLTNTKQDLEVETQKLNELKQKLDELEEERKRLIDEKTYYEAAAILLKDSGIKTKIIKQYLPIINKVVNKYLASMDFFVNFNLDESFKETIKSRHRDEFSYASFSEGEKQRIDMALMLTWRAVAKLKNSSNTNLLILDEVFDSSLDVNGTEYLMQLLHLLEGVNLFVISHKGDILQDKFRSIIRFEKINNFSRIAK
jgi:DNA repair exonuclease SbcCD ATPase subunit